MQLTYIQHVYKHTSHADEKHIIIFWFRILHVCTKNLYNFLLKNIIWFAASKCVSLIRAEAPQNMTKDISFFSFFWRFEWNDQK